MSGHRSPDAQILERVTRIYELLIAGYPRRKILQYAAESGWGVKSRQIEAYIAQANALLEADAEVLRSQELGKAVNRLNLLYFSSLKVQDYQRALAAQRELNKLLGLYAPEQHSLTGEWVIKVVYENQGIEADD